MMKEYNVILVDDHKLFRNGLVFLLKDIPEIKKVYEAADGLEFIDIIKSKKINLALMDINMPNMDGIEATKKALLLKPEMKIIAVSMYSDEEYYDKMIEAGVKGFILKNSGFEELQSALKTVINGGKYFSQDLLVGILDKKKQKINKPKLVKLTDREIEILKLICEGFSNIEIAGKLFISQRTVDRHRANLLSKTNCHNSSSLVMYAVRNKIIEI